jgi:hypothetical protein
LTTSTIPYQGGNIEMEFDFIDHKLVVRDSTGGIKEIALENISVAQFYASLMDLLKSYSIEINLLPVPFDPAKTGSDIPYAEDNQHSSYDRNYVSSFFKVLTIIEPIFKLFRGRFLGKCSPLHFFWHSFDLALTRFSGKAVQVSPGADPVTKEAYSHEVISAGFWPGDDGFPEPAFYAYAYPEPKGLNEKPLKPEQSWWQDMGGSHLALYRYDDFMKSSNPEDDLMYFLQSSYIAAADLAGWPREELELEI